MKSETAKESGEYPTAHPFLPADHNLANLRRAAGSCEGCPLFRRATQTVFGQGAQGSRVVLVGEQPGEQEDRAGKPFVGPAGRLLDDVLAQVGLDRKTIYVTNAVKHFKWEERGKRRLHAKPSAREIEACRPWLEAELDAVQPQALVCLGATAAQALLGRAFRITRSRGEFIESDWAPWVMATYHPSALLRAPDEVQRRKMREEFTADLQAVADKIVSHSTSRRHSK